MSSTAAGFTPVGLVIVPSHQGGYAHGETIRPTLLIRWREEFDAVMVEFRKLYSLFGEAFGNRIELRSRSQKRVAEEPRPYTEVKLEGVVPHETNSGMYVCACVRCFVPGRGWVTLFKEVSQVALRVRRAAPPSPQGKEGAQFLGMEFRE